MRKYISTLAALSAALSMAVVVPAAQARPGHHYRGHGGHYSHGGHHYGHYAHRGHRGHGYWHNGRWIALGIGAAIAAGAAGAYDRDCYYRGGYRYCD
jgi:hypothetical protein